MSYEQIEHLKESEFKRLCGVKPQIFGDMVRILKQDLPASRNRGGQPKLSTEEFKRSKVKPLARIEILADKGDRGIKKIYNSSYTPIKKRKKKPLTLREKEYNRRLAKHRIYVEHVIRSLKIFRILA